MVVGLSRIGHKIGGAFPAWAKPSRIAAYTGVGTSVAILLFKAPANGEEQWVNRLARGVDNYRAYGTVSSLLAMDENGGPDNILSVATRQISGNAPGAIFNLVGYGIGAAILKVAGM